jgi:hypothetical protein
MCDRRRGGEALIIMIEVVGSKKAVYYCDSASDSKRLSLLKRP